MEFGLLRSLTKKPIPNRSALAAEIPLTWSSRIAEHTAGHHSDTFWEEKMMQTRTVWDAKALLGYSANKSRPSK